MPGIKMVKVTGDSQFKGFLQEIKRARQRGVLYCTDVPVLCSRDGREVDEDNGEMMVWTIATSTKHIHDHLGRLGTDGRRILVDIMREAAKDGTSPFILEFESSSYRVSQSSEGSSFHFWMDPHNKDERKADRD